MLEGTLKFVGHDVQLFSVILDGQTIFFYVQPGSVTAHINCTVLLLFLPKQTAVTTAGAIKHTLFTYPINSDYVILHKLKHVGRICENNVQEINFFLLYYCLKLVPKNDLTQSFALDIINKVNQLQQVAHSDSTM